LTRVHNSVNIYLIRLLLKAALYRRVTTKDFRWW